MFYDKKVRYLDHYENGERTGGCGFAKTEIRDGLLKIDLAVKGLHPTDSFVRDVLMCGEGREAAVGTISIENGSGVFRHICRVEEQIGKTGIAYNEWKGIRIFLGGSREIAGRWESISGGKASRGKPDADKEETGGNGKTASLDVRPESQERLIQKQIPKKEVVKSISTEAENRRDRDSEIPAETENGREQNSQSSTESESRREPVEFEKGPEQSLEMQGQGEKAGNQSVEKQEQEEKSPAPEGGGKESEKKEAASVEENSELKAVETKEGEIRGRSRRAAIKLQEDKWQQLSAIYPHIRPFEDERDYLSIGPSDFVLFPTRYYKAVNNSFLLHGYYNYHHLLLTRVEKRGEMLYYVGVPGNYYEKEKQVALMFGFESFECAEEPAQTGDFGYYMMRVEV